MCSYDLVFHEDSTHSDTKDHENGHRIKIQRVDDQRSEQPPKDQSNRLGVIMAEKTVRNITVMEKEAGMVKTTLRTEGAKVSTPAERGRMMKIAGKGVNLPVNGAKRALKVDMEDCGQREIN